MSARHLRCLAAILFLVALVARFVPGPRTIDDAYITFRYARNLLAGDGFAFNPGERVLGTTTPLFTFLMAGLGLFAGGVNAPFPEIAPGVSAIADGLSAVALLAIGRKLGASWAGVASALAWAIAPFSVTFAIGGLETSVYVLLLLATCWAYLEKRYALAALLGSLSLLTRPDALLLIAPLAFDRLFIAPRRGAPRVHVKEFLLFAVPLAAWGIFAWIYFGSPFPQTVAAKSEAYQIESLTALVRLLQHYATPFLEHLTFGNSWITIGLILYPFLSYVGWRHATTHERSAWVLAVFPWVYLLVFAIANPFIFRWYLTPPLPFYFLFILVGLFSLIEQVLRWAVSRLKRTTHALPFFAALLIVGAPFALQLRGWTLHHPHGPQRPTPEMAWIELELMYKQVAEQLFPELAGRPSATLAASDVGVLGYFTEARILDLVGLNSREPLAYYPLDPALFGDFIYAVSPDLVIAEQPDYVVILEIYGRFGLLKDERFGEQYELIYEIPQDIYGSRGMLVFHRK
jgi:arabinofuranosyltransferase